MVPSCDIVYEKFLQHANKTVDQMRREEFSARRMEERAQTLVAGDSRGEP